MSAQDRNPNPHYEAEEDDADDVEEEYLEEEDVYWGDAA